MRKSEISEAPVLPSFPTEPFDVNVTLGEDKTVEVIKVMAKGQVSAIQIALYTMSRWPDEKISQIISLKVDRV